MDSNHVYYFAGIPTSSQEEEVYWREMVNNVLPSNTMENPANNFEHVSMNDAFEEMVWSPCPEEIVNHESPIESMDEVDKFLHPTVDNHDSTHQTMDEVDQFLHSTIDNQDLPTDIEEMVNAYALFDNLNNEVTQMPQPTTEFQHLSVSPVHPMGQFYPGTAIDYCDLVDHIGINKEITPSPFGTEEEVEKMLNDFISSIKLQKGGAEVLEPQPGPSGLQLLRKRPSTLTNPQIPKRPRTNTPVVDVEHFFEVNPINERYVAKYRTTCYNHQARFKNMEQILPEEFPVKVHEILDGIFEKLLAGVEQDEMVRVNVDADGLNHPYNGKILKMADFDVNLVIDKIAKILNSNQKILMDGGELYINIVRVRLPQKGSGKRERNVRKRTKIDIAEWVRSKHTTITINNKDELCLARALVVAVAHRLQKEHPEDRQLYKRYCYIADGRKPLQESEAIDLHHNAGVPLGPCGIPEIQKFQEYLTEFQILVYEVTTYNQRIFTGPTKPDTHRIALLCYNNHYSVITTITGFHAASYVCDDCLAPTRDLDKHICKRVCYACKSATCKPKELAAHNKCHACNRYFYNDTCKALHLSNRTCARKYRCKHCGRSGHLNKGDKCFKRECHVCKNWVPMDHLCHIRRKNYTYERFIDFHPVPKYFFYDFECVQESGTHVPNLVICKDEGTIHKVFSGANCRDAFCDWIFKENCGIPPKDNINKVFIAHYAKAYDSYLVLEYLHRNHLDITPIKTGLKILALTVKQFNCTFLDSHSFIPMPLSKFPATFGLTELKKGYFPHYFNTDANQDYVGPIPETHFYGADTMAISNREKFIKWHDGEKAAGKTFNLKEELRAYCDSDVQILKDACIAFRKEFLETTEVDPFTSITIASVCHKVFRTHILKPRTIGIVPPDGYRGRKKQQSKKALQWMEWVSRTEGITIINATSLVGEKKIGVYFVDGYCTARKLILEFHGCYYHGCPKCFGPRINNSKCGQKMADLYAATLDKEQYFRNYAPDHQLRVMWECDFDRMVKMNADLGKLVEEMDIPEAINPRDAFYGGRTHASTLYANAGPEEAIRYYDFVSLYPTINKFGKMPVGHPQVHYPDTYSKGEFFGIIKATVLAPRGLYHPVLPYRARGKLLFPLCRTCAETNQQDPCRHTDTERQLVGMWCTPEVDTALDEGYKILAVQCVWHYAEHAEYGKSPKYPQGLFGEYVDLFLKIKQEASGWPAWVKSDQDKDNFLGSYLEKERVTLDKGKVNLNTGRRALAKLCLNSFWGRFGMREDLPQTEYVTEYDRYIELLTSPEYEMSDAHIVSDDKILVSYKMKKNFIPGSPHTNVVVAAFTTTLARLKLFELLKILGKECLYMDTDSVIFIGRKDYDPLASYLGENLGKMTNEITAEYGDGTFINEFVSGGPKNYGYQVTNGKTLFKVKGFSQNFNNNKRVNFKKMLEL